MNIPPPIVSSVVFITSLITHTHTHIDAGLKLLSGLE
jgi:hypothetical protein